MRISDWSSDVCSSDRPTNSFAVLYAAQDLPTALAEKVIRDRLKGRAKRILLQADIEEQVVASLVARMPPKLLDLRPSGSRRLGVPTDGVRGRSQRAGPTFSQQIYNTPAFECLADGSANT